MGSFFGHGYHSRPAGGHLSKPLHELLPNSWKLFPCQLQLANEQSLTGQEFTCFASPDHPVQKIWKIWNASSKILPFYFLQHILIKIYKICTMFWLLILVSKISFQRNIERQINLQKCWFWNQVPNIERTIFQSNIDQF